MPTQPQATLGQFAQQLPDGTPAIQPVEQNPEAIAANTEQWRQLLAREDLLRGAGIAGAYVQAGQPFGLGVMAALNQQAETSKLRQGASENEARIEQRRVEGDQRADAEAQRIALGGQELAESSRASRASEALQGRDIARRTAADTATAAYQQKSLELKELALRATRRSGGDENMVTRAHDLAQRYVKSDMYDTPEDYQRALADYAGKALLFLKGESPELPAPPLGGGAGAAPDLAGPPRPAPAREVTGGPTPETVSQAAAGRKTRTLQVDPQVAERQANEAASGVITGVERGLGRFAVGSGGDTGAVRTLERLKTTVAEAIRGDAWDRLSEDEKRKLIDQQARIDALLTDALGRRQARTQPQQ